MIMNVKSIIGKTVEYVKEDKGTFYILFNDGKTYIELEEQDYHAYHDCSMNAREIDIMTATEEHFEYLLELSDAKDLP